MTLDPTPPAEDPSENATLRARVAELERQLREYRYRETALSASALDQFASAGCRAAHNRPYAGGYGLERHAAPGRGLHALQIEVCRSAYLDAALREPGPGLPAVARVLARLVQRMAGELAAGRGLQQAAE